MSTEVDFCTHCGHKLETGSEFCPKCGKAVTATSAGTTAVASATGETARTGGKIGSIDKRVVIAIGIIILILIVPVFPRQKTIYVAGQTATTVSYQSTTYQTSLQAYPTTNMQPIQVYVGTLQYVPSNYYGYYGQYYGGCYRGYFGYIHCGYSGWPNYNMYTTTITVNPSDNVVNVQDTQQAYGYLSTVVLTKADGSTVTYSNVFNDNLQKSGTSTYQTLVTQTSTVTQSAVVMTSSVTNVACDNCIPQNVTEHVSLLQLLFGF